MKRVVFVVAFVLVVFSLGGLVRAQQISGRGFTILLCIADQAGQTGNAQVGVSIQAIAAPDAFTGIGSASVTITHGAPVSGSGSTHTVVYVDANLSGELDCGDVVISVT